ncbi:MAG TPA: sulfatase [Gaiellaceae bacterium]|nr:sulfatase [Gaiellaceae bacterium]
MKIAVVTFLAALALAPAAAAAQPNVILIVTDDQRWDTLAYMPTVTAELVGKGVTFSNAFVVDPVCCPSRSSILTGLHSHSHGVWGISPPYGGFGRFRDSSTLPVWLDSVGYETALVGKYLNGYVDAPYVPPGWDRWFANTRHPNHYFEWEASNDGTEVTFGSEPADYSTDVLAARAVEFIRASTEPLFLYFAPKAPHRPFTPAPRHKGEFEELEPWRPPSWNEENLADKPRYMRSRERPASIFDRMRQGQLESLLAVDEAIADLLAALRETRKLRDTLIIFTSDNGFLWGEHRKAHKLVPYEESIRVPLVVRWDALDVPARTAPQTALNIDLAETVAAAAGIAVPTEGRNLLPLVLGTSARGRTSFLFEHFAQPWRVPSYCAFRGQRWKYVQYATGEEELYDLRRDPYELRSEHRARRALIMGFRRRVRRSACRPPLGYQPLTLCTRTGTDGPDRMRGWKRSDWLCAGRGGDRINVLRGGKDAVRCGPGSDRVRADRRDVLIGCELRGRRLPLR